MGGSEQDETSDPAVDRGRAVLEAFVRVAMPEAVDPSARESAVPDAPDQQIGSGEAR